MDVESAKRAAGERAALLVEDGMTLGLGTGSTARWFIAAVGDLVLAGTRVTAVPTSRASEDQARALGIPLIELGADGLDLVVDGADCVNPALGLIKGYGGALVREKIVAASARRFVVVVDSAKLRPALAGRVPVEVVPFGVRATLARLERTVGAGVSLRPGPAGAPLVTDNGNLVADCALGAIEDPPGLAARLDGVPGVVGHGLFLGMAERVVVAHPDGSVEEMVRP